MEYIDLVRFNSKGKIAYVKEFFDNHHVDNHSMELEEKET